MKNTIYGILIFGIALFLGYGLSKIGRKEQVRTITTTDTLILVRYDTIRTERPKPTYIHTTDTLYIRDTITQTIVASLPIETKLYEDSLYRAQISGIRPKLEFIEVFPRTEYKYIYRTEKVAQNARKWGIGVQAGYGVYKGGLSPYIGVGISYNLIRW